MSDETEFDRALQLAGNFTNIKFQIKIYHPSGALGCYLEVDNLAQKGKTVFVFEGKSKNETLAIKQLKDRYISLIRSLHVNIRTGFIKSYKSVRLFYYSFDRKVINEFDFKGNKISSTKFNDLNNLAQILHNL